MEQSAQALRQSFLDGMSRAAASVAVITTDGPGGRLGVTISSLTSVSAEGDAPSLLVCVHHMSVAAAAILKNRKFCANLLQESQRDISDLFSGRTKVEAGERFGKVAWTQGRDGCPVITGSAASFECELSTALLWETHYIFIGKVAAITLEEGGSALIYASRGYRRSVALPEDGQDG